MSPTPMNEECLNCKFFRAVDALADRTGKCHAAPPVRLPRAFAASATAGNRVRDETLTWGWPDVRENDWCGVWVKRSGHRSAAGYQVVP